MRMNKKLKGVLAFGLAASFVLTSTMGALATDEVITPNTAAETYVADVEETDPEETIARNVTVIFNATNGVTFEDGSTNYSVEHTEYDTITLPKVVAEDGYEFEGWIVQGEYSHSVPADATVGLKDMAHFIGDQGVVQFTATGKAKETTEPETETDPEETIARNVTVIFNATNGVTFEDGSTNYSVEHTEYDTITLPKVVEEEGYEFAGWTVQGEYSHSVPADATVGLKDMAHFIGDQGVVQFTATGKAKETTEPETETDPEETIARNVTVIFNATNGVTFEDGSTNYSVEHTEYDTITLPKVVEEEGYEFAGWTVQGEYSHSVPADATVGLKDMAHFIGDQGVVQFTATGKAKETTEPETEARKVVVIFSATNGVTFTDGSTNYSVDYTENDTITLPEVVESNGYEFAGWTVQGEYSHSVPADATVGLKGMAHFIGDTGYVEFTASGKVLETEPETDPEETIARNVTVIFNATNGVTFEDGSTNYSVEHTEYDTITLPKVVEEEGYEFAGWTVQGEYSHSVPADATVGLKDMAHFIGDQGVVQFTATGKAKETTEPETEARKVVVIFSAANGVTFTDGSTNYSVDYTENDTITLPEVVASEGYEFAGWTVQGEYSHSVPADATVGLKGMAHFIGDTGYIEFTASGKALETEPAETEARKVTVIFSAANGVTFTDGSTNYSVDYTENDTITLPEVVASEGYEFAGWTVQGEYSHSVPADATVGLKGMAHFIGDTGVIEFTASGKVLETETETETETTTETETETTTTETEPATEAPTTESERVTDTEEETTEEATTEEETETDKKTVVTEKNNKSDDNSNKTSDSAVKTGDTTTVMPYVIALFAAAALIVVLALKKRRTF